MAGRIPIYRGVGAVLRMGQGRLIGLVTGGNLAGRERRRFVRGSTALVEDGSKCLEYVWHARGGVEDDGHVGDRRLGQRVEERR
jgi:hypothetical protein